MSISDQELQERTQALIEEVDPHAVDQFTFRGAQFDAGLALVHFPEGKGGLGLSRGKQAVVDEVLRAYAYDVSKELSIFIGLIVTNCIVMGRLEAFALGNGVWKSFLDGIGNAFGYGFILILVAFFRELLGSGKLMGVQVIPDFIYEMGYEDNGLMLLSPMALITVGLIIWVQRSRNTKLIEEN